MKNLIFFVLLSTGLFADGISSEIDIHLPRSFDSLGPTVKSLTTTNVRKVHYIDDGEIDWLPVVFTGGLGTSVRVIRLLDFLRTMREELKIRIISVERNGFGQTAYDSTLDMTSFSEDVEAVLELLNIKKFALFGISGGGPYTAKIANRNPKRILSVHMAATSPSIGSAERCEGDQLLSVYRDMLRYPMQFFAFSKSSPMQQVDGFQDTAFDEAARAHNLRGQQADPAPLDHETELYCREGEIDSSAVKAPVYIYRGLADAILGSEDPSIWQQAYPNAKLTIRSYPGEGHDVQYRHLDQILLDIRGYGDKILLCQDEKNKMVNPNSSGELITLGATFGLCAWNRL